MEPTVQDFLDFRNALGTLQYQAAISGAQGLYTRNALRTSMTMEGPGLTDPTTLPGVNPPSDPFSFLLPVGDILNNLYAIQDMNNILERQQVMQAAKQALQNAAQAYQGLAVLLSNLYGINVLNGNWNLRIPGAVPRTVLARPANLRHIQVTSHYTPYGEDPSRFLVLSTFFEALDAWNDANNGKSAAAIGFASSYDDTSTAVRLPYPFFYEPRAQVAWGHAVDNVQWSYLVRTSYQTTDIFIVDSTDFLFTQEVGHVRYTPILDEWLGKFLDGLFTIENDFNYECRVLPPVADINYTVINKTDVQAVKSWARDVNLWGISANRRVRLMIIVVPTP